MSDYRVLARKYRPQNFDDLIGQEVLVRTLTNAIAKDRLAHAFLLTGIRGIGKTTTARIIARALNCLGAEENATGPAASPCGVCANCVAIAEDRHVDVIEMDAASRTGVDDIRDIIETVHYAPTSARFKIYIIDEVHMLSKNAFNALLKTLEEPPPHVKFIFATTELRKIPVTILSRCQRFNLKRVDQEALAQHLANICTKEAVEAEAESLALIASAAEGSVRDALSVLDQAIVHTDNHISTAAIRDMLGMSDKSRSFDLLEHLLKGDAPKALNDFRELHTAGADPTLLLQDLLELVHFISLIKLAAGMEEHTIAYADTERQRGKAVADTAAISSLTLLWQMLLKAVQEVRHAPNPMLSTEMAFIRITHAAQLPPPADIVRSLKQQQTATGSTTTGGGPGSTAPAALSSPAATHAPATQAAAPLLAPQSQPDSQPVAVAQTFEDAVQLFREHREMLLYSYLVQEAQLVDFRVGHIELNLPAHVPQDAPGRIGKRLSDWTGTRWLVSLSKASGKPTLAQQADAAFELQKTEAAQQPLVATVLELFPGAEITHITKQGE